MREHPINSINEDSSSDVEERLFTAIISMCSSRILYRMRLKKDSRNAKKKATKDAIQIVVECLRGTKSPVHQNPQLSRLGQSFLKQARDVIRLIDMWTNYQTHSQLERLVEGVYQLRKIGDVNALLSNIPDDILCPSSKASLVNILGKVARYREAARFLCRIAKKFPLTRQMQIVTVELPNQVFARIPTNNYSPTIQQVVNEREELIAYRDRLARIYQVLGVSKLRGNERLAEQAKKTLKGAKIHAEVQLIYHCELTAHNIRLWPRVIRSSKDACWLCNAFILSHGKMYTPKCHGKLYPGWRLPLLTRPAVPDLANGFNGRLQMHMRESIQLLLVTRKKYVHSDTNESTLSVLLHGMSTSTLPIEEPPTPAVVEKREEMHSISSVESQAGDDVCSKSNHSESKGKEVQVEMSLINENADKAHQPQTDSSSTLSKASSISDSSSLDSNILMKSGEISPGESSPLHTAGLIEIQVEYVIGSGTHSPGECQEKLTYKVEKLREGELVELQKNPDISIVDAESLQGEITCDGGRGTPTEVYIKACGSVLRVVLAKAV